MVAKIGPAGPILAADHFLLQAYYITQYIEKTYYFNRPRTRLIIMHKMHVIIHGSLVLLYMKTLLHPCNHKSFVSQLKPSIEYLFIKNYFATCI